MFSASFPRSDDHLHHYGSVPVPSTHPPGPPVLPRFTYLHPAPSLPHLNSATDRLRPPDYLHHPPYRHPSVPAGMASSDASPSADNYDQMQADYEEEGVGTSGSRKLKNTKRAAQNRAAQRAFRERKDRYVRELEARSAQLDEFLRRQSRLEERERRVAEREQALGIAPTYPLPSPEDDVKPTFVADLGASELPRPPKSPVAPITPPPSAAASARPSVKIEPAYVQPRPPPSSSGSSSSRPTGSGSSVLLHRPPPPPTVTSGPTAEERLQALETELDVVRMQIRHQDPQVSDARPLNDRAFAPSRPALVTGPSRPSLPSLPSIRYPSFATRPAQPPYLDASPQQPHPGRPTFESQPPQIRQLPPLASAAFGSPHPSSSERLESGPIPHPHTLPPISAAFQPPTSARYPSPTSAKRTGTGSRGHDEPRLKKQRSLGPETLDRREAHHLTRRESAPVVKAESPGQRKLESPAGVAAEGHRAAVAGARSPAVSEDHSTTPMTALTNVTPLSEHPPPSPPARGLLTSVIADKLTPAGAVRVTLPSLPSLSWASPPPPLRKNDSHGSAVTTSSGGVAALTSGRTPSPPGIGLPRLGGSVEAGEESLTLPPLSAGSVESSGRRRLPSLHSLPATSTAA